jgi:type II secretory pathway pseudopilin PulG
MNRCRSMQGGFSYMWTLMLIGVLSIGLVVTTDLYSVTLRREKERQLIFVGHEFRDAIRSYYEFGVAGSKEYPQRIEDLLKDPRSARLVRHLRRIYQDPISGSLDWGFVRVGGRVVGVHSLSETRPIKQDGFDVDDAAFAGADRISDWVFAYPPDAVFPNVRESGGDAALSPSDPQQRSM